MKRLQTRYAEIHLPGRVDKYTMSVDTDNMGFDREKGSFLIEGRDGSVTSYWNCPVKMYQEVVDVDDNEDDFTTWGK